MVRFASEQDAEALSALAAKLFTETYAASTPAEHLAAYVRENFSADQQRTEILDADSVMFIARDEGGALIGFAHAHNDGDAMLLNRIYIERSAHGTGLAQSLVAQVETECRARSKHILRLSVFDQNARAIAFYRRQGFVAVSTTPFAVGEEIQSDIVMEKHLGIEPPNS